MEDIEVSNLRNNSRYVLSTITEYAVTVTDMVDEVTYSYTLDEFIEFMHYLGSGRFLGTGIDIGREELIHNLQSDKTGGFNYSVMGMSGILNVKTIFSLYGFCDVDIHGCRNGHLILPYGFAYLVLDDIDGLNICGDCDNLMINFNYDSRISGVSLSSSNANKLDVYVYGSGGKTESYLGLSELCGVETLEISFPVTLKEFNQITGNFYVCDTFNAVITEPVRELDLSFISSKAHYISIEFTGNAVKKFLDDGIVLIAGDKYSLAMFDEFDVSVEQKGVFLTYDIDAFVDNTGDYKKYVKARLKED